MPPKVKITRERILETAVALVRTDGEASLNARAIAAALQCSTQPIFSNFSTMKELQEAVLTAAFESYLAFLQTELTSGKYPPYKAFGMAYIRFAKEESQLFRLLFMCDRSGSELTPSLDFEQSVQMIKEANGVSEETAKLMHLEMWSCVHGIAVMSATSFLALDWEIISRMLSDVYRGLQAHHTKEELQDACD